MRSRVAGLLLVVLWVALRSTALTADLPPALGAHYQDVGSPVYDEGWWTANARERALFGSTLGTGFDLVWVSPFYTAAVALAVAIGGVGLAPARVLSILVGAGGVLLLLAAGTAGARSAAEKRAATLAALLWSVSFAGAHLGRLAIPESTGIALGLGAVFALLRGPRAGTLIAGGLGALAVLTKPHFGFLVPTLFASRIVLSRRAGLSAATGLVPLAAGFALPFAVWGAIVTAHAHEAADLARFYLTDTWFARPPSDLGAVLGGLKPATQTLIGGVVYRHPIFLHLPVVSILAVLVAPDVWRCALRSSGAGPHGDAAVVFGLWALFGGAFVAMLPFQPARYFLPVLPALAFLAAIALTREHRPGIGGMGIRFVRWALATAVLAQILFALLTPWITPALWSRSAAGHVRSLDPEVFRIAPFFLRLLDERSLAPFADVPRENAYVAALALVGTLSLLLAVFLALATARRLSRLVLPPLPSRRLAAAAVVVLVAYQGGLWGAWLPRRTHTVLEMGRALARQVPGDAVISPAGTYSLANRLRYDSRAVREGRMYDPSGGSTHFLVLGSHPYVSALGEGEIERRYPGSRRVGTFEITGDYVYHLYKAARPGDP